MAPYRYDFMQKYWKIPYIIILNQAQISPVLLYEPRHKKAWFYLCENKRADQLYGDRTA